MAVEGVGEFEAAVSGFRKLLERAEGEDAARSAALDSLLDRSMQAVTWSGSGEALRTLRNRKGEQALALWSGEDTLAAAAAQLGWRAADGSLAARSVDAREAIEAALAQGVQFVVIDLGSGHALELLSDELSLLLAVKQKRAPKATRGAQQGQTAKSGKGLIDFDLPFVHGRAEAGQAAAGASREEAVAEVSVDLLSRAFAAPTDDQPGSKDNAAAVAPVAVASPPLAAQVYVQAGAGEGANSKVGAGAQTRTTIGHAAPAAPAGPPAAPPAAPKPLAADDRPAPGRPAAKAPEEAKTSAIKSAARALATMIGSAEPASTEAASSEAGASEAEQPQVFAEGALRPLDLGLSEAVIGAIAETLRGFPEVEWACELSDGTEVPVIGVRVSPQFVTRLAQIEHATLAAGTARGAELRVLMLSDAALMREARTHGTAFYPWKKRR